MRHIQPGAESEGDEDACESDGIFGGGSLTRWRKI